MKESPEGSGEVGTVLVLDKSRDPLWVQKVISELGGLQRPWRIVDNIDGTLKDISGIIVKGDLDGDEGTLSDLAYKGISVVCVGNQNGGSSKISYVPLSRAYNVNLYVL